MTMINKEIRFPLLELTDWVFDGEKELGLEINWDGIHHIKEKDFEKQYQRVLIDCNGKVLKVTGNKVIRKKGVLLSFIIAPTLIVEFNLELTGRTTSLEDVKRKILSRSSENYQITNNKLMTVLDYNSKIKSAKTFEELFKIATFTDEE